MRVPITFLLLIVIGLAGCSPDDQHAKETDPSSAAPTPTFARSAEVDAFCTAAIEAGSSIDEADSLEPEDWTRIVEAFDELYAVGVPRDFPQAGVAELDHFAAVVREHDNVADLAAALDAGETETGVIDRYLRRNCDGNRY